MTFLPRRRLAIAAAAGVLGVLPLAPGIGSSHAHTCAQVRVYVSGSTTPIGSCHTVCPNDEIGGGADPTVSGTGAGFTVCVKPPVAAP